jgi:hypothetical protein
VWEVGIDFDAGVVELVDAPDSKSGSVRSVGSIPTARTIFGEMSDDVGMILDRARIDLPTVTFSVAVEAVNGLCADAAKHGAPRDPFRELSCQNRDARSRVGSFA